MALALQYKFFKPPTCVLLGFATISRCDLDLEFIQNLCRIYLEFIYTNHRISELIKIQTLSRMYIFLNVSRLDPDLVFIQNLSTNFATGFLECIQNKSRVFVGGHVTKFQINCRSRFEGQSGSSKILDKFSINSRCRSKLDKFQIHSSKILDKIQIQIKVGKILNVPILKEHP